MCLTLQSLTAEIDRWPEALENAKLYRDETVEQLRLEHSPNRNRFFESMRNKATTSRINVQGQDPKQKQTSIQSLPQPHNCRHPSLA
jgi:hypothetical protein